MRKNIIMYGLTCLLTAVLLAFLLPGCGAKSEPAAQEVTPADEPNQSAQVEASAPVSPPESSPNNEVAAILAKSQKIDSMSFEYVIEDLNDRAEGKVWIKGSKTKNEITMEGQTVINIYDIATGEIYTYIPQENMAFLETIEPEMVGWYERPNNYYDDLELDSVKIVGTETIDGHKCKVMTYSNADEAVETKMWVSEEYGIPLRIEGYYEDGDKVVLEYKNLKVGPVSDDEFKLPDNVTIMDNR